MTDHQDARCQAPALAAMIPRYEHGLLEDGERQRFEAHLLGCDDCFAELERGAILREAFDAPGVLGALEAAQPGGWARLGVLLRRPEFALMVGCLVLFALTLEKASPPDELARFPTEVQVTEALRAGAPEDALAELIRAGSGHLNLGQYEQAEQFLRAARERVPHDPTAAHLLGLAIALQGDPGGAIPHLEAAAEESAEASWLLALAYLKCGSPETARRLLGEIAAAGGARAEDARALIRRVWSE